MKIKTRPVNSLLAILIILIGCGVGVLAGNLFVGDYNPPWKYYELESEPKDLVKIEAIEISSLELHPAGDSVYVSDNNGTIYSNTVFQTDWSIADTTSTWKLDRPDDCTSERLGPTRSHLWDNPPLERNVIDSSRVIFERPLSTIVRCYVLLDNGNLEVWVHEGNAMDLMSNVKKKLLIGFVGLVIGVIISYVVLRFLKQKLSKDEP